MQERELLRQDRAVGLSNDQFDRVHSGTREYDLIVDTSSLTVVEVAKEIMVFINSDQRPKGFNNMRRKLL
jgi:chloramphenicol 3-O phosphotransferase